MRPLAPCRSRPPRTSCRWWRSSTRSMPAGSASCGGSAPRCSSTCWPPPDQPCTPTWPSWTPSSQASGCPGRVRRQRRTGWTSPGSSPSAGSTSSKFVRPLGGPARSSRTCCTRCWPPSPAHCPARCATRTRWWTPRCCCTSPVCGRPVVRSPRAGRLGAARASAQPASRHRRARPGHRLAALQQRHRRRRSARKGDGRRGRGTCRPGAAGSGDHRMRHLGTRTPRRSGPARELLYLRDRPVLDHLVRRPRTRGRRTEDGATDRQHPPRGASRRSTTDRAERKTLLQVLITKYASTDATVSSPTFRVPCTRGEGTVRTPIGSVGPTGFEPVTSRV